MFPKLAIGVAAVQQKTVFLFGILCNKPYGPSSSYITGPALTRGSLTTTQKTDRIHNRPPYVLPFPDNSRPNAYSGAHRNLLEENSFILKWLKWWMPLQKAGREKRIWASSKERNLVHSSGKPRNLNLLSLALEPAGFSRDSLTLCDLAVASLRVRAAVTMSGFWDSRLTCLGALSHPLHLVLNSFTIWCSSSFLKSQVCCRFLEVGP